MFKGRSVETKKNLIRLLFERAQRELDLASANLEVTITKTPKQNWGVVVNPETKSPQLQSRGLGRIRRSMFPANFREN